MRPIALLTALILTTAAQAQSLRVIDGDTVDINGERIRLATIDAPETGGRARCAYERDLGDKATARLRELLTDANIFIARGDLADGRLIDRYGRTLAVVYADGQAVGAVLVQEGLARWWTGRRESWC